MPETVSRVFGYADGSGGSAGTRKSAGHPTSGNVPEPLTAGLFTCLAADQGWYSPLH